MANEKEQGQQLQIELTPEIANGTYEQEFGTIDLGMPQPAATEGVGRTATPFGAPDANA